MLDTKAREGLTRQELISHQLRLLALVVDPVLGHLVKLSADIDVHPTTFSTWIKQGFIPHFQCKKLKKRFGKKVFPLDELCPEEFRNV